MVLASIVACYRPTLEQPCTLSCETDTDCPSQLTCTNQICGLADRACGDAGVADTQDANLCLGAPGSPLAMTCFDSTTAIDRTLTGDLDTDNDPRCEADHTVACFIVGHAIEVPDTLDVHGGRPLVLWSATDLSVSGLLDAASHRVLGKRGPGADPASCTIVSGHGNQQLIPILGGGGGGGGYATAGGLGGLGRVQNGTAATSDLSPATAVALHGGCPGGNGGFSANTGGAGGGAVFLMAASTIHIAATINASGSSGGGGDNASRLGGGGGGGSGGLIGLDASTIVVDNANVVALGGSGGGGAGRPVSTLEAGIAGTDPSPPTVGAAGGQTISNNRGGVGSNSTAAGFDGGPVTLGGDGGGGGGGGGAGYILTFGSLMTIGTSTLAPPPS